MAHAPNAKYHRIGKVSFEHYMFAFTFGSLPGGSILMVSLTYIEHQNNFEFNIMYWCGKTESYKQVYFETLENCLQ